MEISDSELFAELAGISMVNETAQFCDQQLDRIDSRIDGSDDPDRDGYFDSAEHIMGIGFVACQRFIRVACNRVDPVKLAELMALGPLHGSGQSMVTIINAAANHWKHHDEDRGPSSDRPARVRLEVFARMNIDRESSYPLSCVLLKLVAPGPTRIGRLLPFLRQWVEALPRA
jgi:hypothetical protein